MDDTFDSTYIIKKEHYKEFITDVEKLALTAYTIPAFVWLDLYKMVDLRKDIAMKVVWKPGLPSGRLKSSIGSGS